MVTSSPQMVTNFSLSLNRVFSLADYRQMFDLNDADLATNILDYSQALSCASAEAVKAGLHISSANAEYFHYSVLALARAVDTLFSHDTDLHPDLSVEEAVLGTELRAQSRHNAQLLIGDYHQGKAAGRYTAHTARQLLEQNKHFDLLLCWGGVFLKAADDSVREVKLLTELAHEVRFFPVVDANGQSPVTLTEVMTAFHQDNYGVELKQVDSNHLPPGQAMLRIWRRECARET